MSIRKHLARRYIPSRTKWKLALKGIAKLYRAIFDELKEEGNGSQSSVLSRAAYRIGVDFGQTLKEEVRVKPSYLLESESPTL